MLIQSLLNFLKLVFVLDFGWDLSESQVILKHLSYEDFIVQSIVPKDTLRLIKAFLSPLGLLTDLLPLFVSINHWFSDSPSTIFYNDKVHLYIRLLISFDLVLLWKHEMFASTNEEEKVLSRTTEHISFECFWIYLSFDLVLCDLTCDHFFLFLLSRYSFHVFKGIVPLFHRRSTYLTWHVTFAYVAVVSCAFMLAARARGTILPESLRTCSIPYHPRCYKKGRLIDKLSKYH